MSGFNKVIIVGRLGRDPERKNFQNGGSVVNLRVATSETWKDKNTGEKMERTEWHSIAILNENLGKIAMSYLQKGSQALFEGKLRTRKWQDQNGTDHYSTEIVLMGYDATLQLLDGKGSGGRERSQEDSYGDLPRGGGGRGEEYGGGDGDAPSGRGGYGDLDDEIPF